MTRSSLRKNAREVLSEIERVRPDAVLSISSQCIAMIEAPPVPIFLFSDAPWMAWLDAYQGIIARPLLAARYAECEARAARRSSGVFFGSRWAAEEARRLYSSATDTRLCDAGVHTVPLGANFTPRTSRDGVLGAASTRTFDRIQFLFVGKDWERKGGPLALEIVELLNRQGVRCGLHIVGCTPQIPDALREMVTVSGFLSVSNIDQATTLERLFLSSHFLLVPTTAECYGVIFAEAQAFAVPPVSRAVHGVTTVVEDGITGILLAPEAGPAQYVARIVELLSSPSSYFEMAYRARARFDQILNWDATAEQMVRVMSAFCAVTK